MRYRRNHGRSSAALGFSATPLIDLIFTLSIFYMLLSRFSTDEQVAMELPAPQGSRASAVYMSDRVVINCRVGEGADSSSPTVLYSIGPNRPESLGVISDRLAALNRDAPGLKIVIRADRRIPYADVRSVMRIVAENKVDLLNVAALAGEGD